MAVCSCGFDEHLYLRGFGESEHQLLPIALLRGIAQVEAASDEN